MGYSGKKIRDRQIYLPFSHFIGKGFMFERPTLQGVNLVARLNEKQTLIENFFLHNDPHKSTEYLNFLGGHYYYWDINLYFVYDKQYNGLYQDLNFIMKQFAKN